MANDFQTRSLQLPIAHSGTNAQLVPAINNASTNQTVHAIHFSNVTTSSVDVYLRLYDGAATGGAAITGGYVLYKVPIPASSTLVIEKPINLECSATATDSRSLQAIASTASAIDAVASVLVIT